jgi:zinc protease
VVLDGKANVDIVMGRATALVASSPDYLAASIANGMLGESKLSSRLAMRLREREGLTYRILSAFVSAGRLGGPWRIALSVNPANVERAIALVREVLRDYADTGPASREIAQQRNAMAGGYAVALATNAEIALLLERMTYLGVPRDFVDTYRTRLEAVGKSEIREAIQRYFGADDLVVVAAGVKR